MDRDSGKLGAVSYEIIPNDKGSDYFGIDNETGVIRTKKLFDDVDGSNLPFIFDVQARDNYLSNVDSNKKQAKVVVRFTDLFMENFF